MAADEILRTFGDSSIKEDVVMNAIEYLTATETQIFNMLGKTKAIAEVHSFLTDTLMTAGSLAVDEAIDFTSTALTTPSRLTNLVEHVAKDFKVTKAQRAAEHYTGEDELSRQTYKALKDWGNAAEFDLVRATLVSGASGTVAKLSGIIEATSKSTNHTSHASGTIFNASHIDGLLQNQYTNSNGQLSEELFLGPWLRLKMDQSIQKSNVVVNNMPMTEIVRTVSTYTTAFSTLRVHTHRYLQQGGDITARILALRPEKLKVAMFIPPSVMELSKNGPYDHYAVYGAFTLEVRNKDSNFYADGFNLSL
jgi:hypothetical protein